MPKILCFNIEYGGQAYELDQAISVITNTQSDVAVILEANTHDDGDSALLMAKQLNWFHLACPANGSAVISRWPISLIDESASALMIHPPNQTAFYVVSIHLNDCPYQPFQATKVPYGSAEIPFIFEAVELVAAAEKARGEEINNHLNFINTLPAEVPLVIAGDFNEPSNLDWTNKAVQAGLCPFAAQFPAAKKIADLAFVDCFRVLHSDEIAQPGYTWPTASLDFNHRRDRIDFIYTRSRETILECRVVENSPSDHCAVVAKINWN